MKSLTALIILTAIILPLLIGCGGTERTDLTTTTETAAEDVTKVDAWITESYKKTFTRTEMPKRHETSASLIAAKNETEGFHISFRSDTDLSGLSLEISENYNGITTEILQEYYITVNGVGIPDPLVPLEDNFTLTKDVTQGFLVRFDVSEDAPSGNHTYTLTLKGDDGSVYGEFDVSLEVMGFSLPVEYFGSVASAVKEDQIYAKEDITSDEVGEYYKKYYDLLLEYGVNADYLPYDVLDSRADAYMSDPRVKSFQVDHNLDDDTLRQINEKLSSNPEWLKKAYFDVYSEPSTVDELNEFIDRTLRVKELCPDISVMAHYFRNIKYDETRDTVALCGEYTDTFLVKSCAWSKGWLADPLSKGYFGNRIEELAGDSGLIWWYVCWEPRDPFCNLQIDESGLNHRKLFIQQYLYGVDGLSYWAANYWRYVSDPWTDMATVKNLSESCYGDGSLLYPGVKVGIEGAVASLRLDCIRDGVEDIALLKLAEREFGREWVEDKISTVVESMTVHTVSLTDFAAFRSEILNALNEKLS